MTLSVNIVRNVTAIGVLTFSLCAQAGISEKDALGTLTATIGDMQYEGITLTAKGERSASASYMDFGVTNMAIVKLQSHDPDADSVMHNVVTLEMPLSHSGTLSSHFGADVSYWPEGMGKPFYVSDEKDTSAVKFEFESIELEGNAHARGSFEAEVCRKDGMFAEADRSDCMIIKGYFDTGLVSEAAL
ncbi:hypothetical protein [Marinobacterium marinum]|uniref:Lipid/polyisoprenoid-binding YceI-like domain-containing protein n=1 Tax=Marinobacterium marinum TaxID=2756129 RepID=A0A7W2AB90_9GAMM|nr:hypothetical protein [Marinobacterium marinum]MBA4501825.1 hypothetical protein [Marinobacterium marinum]